MPSILKQPQYQKKSGLVKIPVSAYQLPPMPQEQEQAEEEQEYEEPAEPVEEPQRSRFEPSIPTKEELAAYFSDELNDLRREAAQEAYNDALNAKRGELQQCIDQVDAQLTAMQRVQREYMEKYALELRFLAVDIAETIMHTKISEDELVLKDLVLQAVGKMRNVDWLDVEISDKLASLVEVLREEFQKPEYRGRVNITTRSVPADTVRVDTQLGVVDASVSTQTARLREVFTQEG